MAAVHPELADEQAYVDRAYDYLDRGLADAEQNHREVGAGDRAAHQAMRRALEILQSSRGSGQLLFGRMDVDDERLYVGRRRIYDHNRDLVAISWHAPAANVFYEATPEDPRGLSLKRVFVEEDRKLKRITDEIGPGGVTTSQAEPGVPASDSLLLELDRSRDGAMREVVATIQAEQYRIIRADRDRVLVVQGGPGTGKTVVGLHRAAWLVFNDAELRREGVLVVAPTIAFLSFISGVLPSLDAGDILQADLGSIYVGEAQIRGEDEPETARVKGSAEMAAVLRRALRARTGWDGGDLELSLGSDRFRIPGSEIASAVEDVRRRSLTHSEARETLRQALSALAFRHYTERQRDTNRPIVANESTIRRLSAFSNALDRIWPSFTPEDLLRSLYGTQSWLVDASEGVLTADDRARLYRPAQQSITEEPWTPDDLFCLDELSGLLSGDSRKYGHVVVDEAQDLSPMQARALARRCPSGSFTVLGDLAQCTGLWIRDSWDELARHLGDTPLQVDTLSIGYRVPDPVLTLASRQLPLIAPGLVASRSIRPGRGEPTATMAAVDDLVADAIALCQAALVEDLTTALVVPDPWYDDIWARCNAADLKVGDGRSGDFALALTLVPVSLVKGLEFDAVVLVSPDEIVRSGPQGRRLLYVAMTRCTQELRIIHAGALPTGLEHLLSIDDSFETTDAVSGIELEGAMPQAATPTLVSLIELLSDDDRALVELLVRRLAGTPDAASPILEPSAADRPALAERVSEP